MFVLTWLNLANYAVEEWLAIQCNYACLQTRMVIPFTSSSEFDFQATHTHALVHIINKSLVMISLGFKLSTIKIQVQDVV